MNFASDICSSYGVPTHTNYKQNDLHDDPDTNGGNQIYGDRRANNDQHYQHVTDENPAIGDRIGKKNFDLFTGGLIELLKRRRDQHS
jgi:hypothetical protein